MGRAGAGLAAAWVGPLDAASSATNPLGLPSARQDQVPVGAAAAGGPEGLLDLAFDEIAAWVDFTIYGASPRVRSEALRAATPHAL